MCQVVVVKTSDYILVNLGCKILIWRYLVGALGREIVQSQGVFANKTKQTLKAGTFPC